MKTIIIITVFILTAVCFNSQAQYDYKFGLGVRAGWPTGVSAKYFLSNSWALEGFVTGRYRGIGTFLLLEKHNYSLHEKLSWFYGGGLHGSFFSSQYYRGPRKDLYIEDSFSYGIDGIVGLEYFISDIPFTVGIDFKPSVEINYGPYLEVGSSITVRYIF